MARYIIDLGFDTVIMHADLAQASAPIEYEVDGEVFATQYQTADARHREWDAAVLVVACLGRDYWLDPSADAPEDEDAYIHDLIRSVDVENVTP